ncbi:MAG: glycosyltransferase [Actinobacteria bacterium]|nr:glycosyltransferase [Actinomycetota bacterium]
MTEIFSYPKITISIVNLDGENYLSDCLKSIEVLNYPQDRIEVIVVDNGSKDNSIKLIEGSFPNVRIIRNHHNAGFAKANNQAAAAASGEYVAFLNNDTKVDEKWLVELLRPIYGSSEVICSGSKVLSFDGKNIDFAGGMINFEGKGFQIDYGLAVEKDIHNLERYLPFVNGGAMLIKKDIFLEAGGFDEDFFAYYEDVDLGWRLWVLGYKVVFSPNSIVYHMHHGTSKNFSEDKLRYLKERNALISIFKNYDENNLANIMSTTLASIFGRIFIDFKFDYKNYYNFDLNNSDRQALSKKLSEKIADLKVDPEPLSSLMAVRDFLDNISKHSEKREKIQKARKRDDKAVFNYFKGQFLSVSADTDYQQHQIELLKTLGIYEIFTKKIKRTLLIISDEVVAAEMAGPAIRVWNFAKILSKYMNVILATPNEPNFPPMEFEIIRYTDDLSVVNLSARADILLFGGAIFSKFKSLKKIDKYLILDIYDPYNLATLEEYKNKPIGEQIEMNKFVVEVLNEQLYHGDYFICASERQRDYWLGMLSALRRVNPVTYYADATFRKMIDVVPFGLPESKPVHEKDVLKGVVKGIKKGDFVVLWGGGIYNWFDTLSLIKAMKIIWDKRKDIKLFFLGVKHPDPLVKELNLVNETVSLAKSLDVYENNVFFNFGWVKYEERQNYLMESDAGIVTHPVHIETRFSFRTRTLDCMWASLPMISTEGDFFSDLIREKTLGIVVKEKDPEDIANAIIRLAENKEFYNKCVSNLKEIAKDYTWDKVCAPVLKYCMDPTKSSKRNNDSDNNENDNSASDRQRQSRSLLRKFFSHLVSSGPKKTLKYVKNYISKK